MSETDTTDYAQTEADEAPPITEADILDRGKGLSPAAVAALDPESPAGQAWTAFKELVARHQEAKAGLEQLTEERNQALYALKKEHDIGFSAIAEVVGVSSSAILYTYERAQGKSAKQIREESERSAAAKAQFRESDPNAKPARKQSPAEKELRKRQREELKAFLESQSAAGEDVADAQAEVEAEEIGAE
jgi:Skp family chaperone for outer membrane proteins